MALQTTLTYSTRTANVVDNNFGSSADIAFYSGTMPTSGTLQLTGSAPQYFDKTFYAGQLIVELQNWSFKVVDGVLVFDPLDYPPVTPAVAAGTISWCALMGTSLSTQGSIIGAVTLGGGNGLVQIANDGAGGGSGLSVQVGDNISVVSFGMKWEI